jgi:hypothetical protein
VLTQTPDLFVVHLQFGQFHEVVLGLFVGGVVRTGVDDLGLKR